MSLDTMKWHVSSCESLTMKDKAWEEEEESEGDVTTVMRMTDTY